MLLTAICGTAVVAQRFNIPAPIAFVLAGGGLAAIPSFPSFTIPPDYILLIFLPVLLTEAAYFTSIRDFKANARPIFQLAIGLVFFTSVIVAWLMQELVPDFGWAAGMTLGAIISPPDAVAATAVARQVKMPKRVQTILEGEGLMNDAMGLVIYKFAVVAALAGGFSWETATLNFGWMAVSGPLIGLALAWGFVRIFPYIREPSVQILSTFLLPFAAYILAEEVHSSGVLAVVLSGLYISWHAPWRFTADFRVSSESTWHMVGFVMNGVVFLLIGMQFPVLLKNMTYHDPAMLAGLALAVSGAVILVRFFWVYAVTYGRLLFLRVLWRRKDPYPPWQNVFIISWAGMRGVVSLATALALPVMSLNEVPFPFRSLIIFLSFSVILVTLVLQGLTLPWLLKKLSIVDDITVLQENWLARRAATSAALARLRELAKNEQTPSSALERIESHYRDRFELLGSGPSTPLSQREAPSIRNHPLIMKEYKIWQDALAAEREAVLSLRRDFKISDDVMQDLMRDIDLMSVRFR